MMPAAGGESCRVMTFHTGVSSPQELASGDFIFSSSVYPDCMADCECNKKTGEKLADGPVQAHLADSLLYRHWDHYREWQYTHLFLYNKSSKKIRAVTGKPFEYPVWNLGSGPGFDVSPDGREMCVVSNHDINAAESTNSDLFLVDLTTETFNPVNITNDNRAFDGTPIYSPDGRHIAFHKFTVPDFEADKKRLALYDRQTGETYMITDHIDNSVDNMIWAPDSGSIYFTIQEKGYTPLFQYFLKSKKIKPLLKGHNIRQMLVTPDNRHIIFTRSSVGEPTEIWKYRIGRSGNPIQLTHINKKVVDEVDIRPAESHWVQGAEGKQVHVFVVKPHGFDPAKKYPLIINIHGGPQMQWSDSFRGDWQVYPGSGYIVAFPNPHGSTGYGQAFTNAISKDWNGRVIEDIYRVTDYLADLPYVDGERMGAMGWSWGGYAVMWLEGHNKRFKALASMMGVYDLASMHGATEELWFPEWDLGGTPWTNRKFYEEASPSSYVKNFDTPCLVITGEKDYRVPYTQSLHFFTGLQKMGVPSRLIVFKNDNHWPSHVKSMPVYYNAHLEWFHKYLKGGKAPYRTEDLIKNTAFDKE
jgi:dipeptidyl aminopeptidase/acylaminoacyl peptidase